LMYGASLASGDATDVARNAQRVRYDTLTAISETLCTS
jgi:hypothetical protein